MTEREKSIFKNLNPGPGSYATEMTKVVKKANDKTQNSFATKIDRFCPKAPGASIFKEPSYVDNPGPGSHLKSIKSLGYLKSTDAKRL